MVLGLFLITPSQADDIRDFQIEGISIGDSLLDYFSKKDIEKSKQDSQYPGSSEYYIVTLGDTELGGLKTLETYERLNVSINKDFIIHNIQVAFYFKDNFKDCKKMQKKIDKELSNLFSDLTRDQYEKKHGYDKTGKSISHMIIYNFENEDSIILNCVDWSTDIEMYDNLSVSASTEIFETWLRTEAYK